MKLKTIRKMMRIGGSNNSGARKMRHYTKSGPGRMPFRRGLG